MLKAFLNCWKTEELRKRILLTAGIVILCRIAANIPCPGVDPMALKEYVGKYAASSGSGMLGMLDMFSGGALQKFAIATLGIMPYISASIIMQLLTKTLPSLEKLSREGEAGVRKITQYTRYLTLLICLIQGSLAAFAMINPAKIGLPDPKTPLVYLLSEAPILGFIPPHIPFVIMTLVVLTCGTMVLMWLGEQITEKGIGNGISIIITINIIARLPQALLTLFDAVNTGTIGGMNFKLVHLLILIGIFLIVVAATVILTQGQRKIPIQIAKGGRGGTASTQGKTTYLPLKVNHAGVMPIIFAGAILTVPGMLCRMIPVLQPYAPYFGYGEPVYIMCYAILILAFTYFWVATQFNPIQTSDNLKREGAFISGIKPGQPTADFLDSTMTKITFAGSIFLTSLAIFPMFLYSGFRIPNVVATFFGGTSLLIIVGVILDTLSQIESHLVTRNYDGFLDKGRLRSRNG